MKKKTGILVSVFIMTFLCNSIGMQKVYASSDIAIYNNINMQEQEVAAEEIIEQEETKIVVTEETIEQDNKAVIEEIDRNILVEEEDTDSKKDLEQAEQLEVINQEEKTENLETVGLAKKIEEVTEDNIDVLTYTSGDWTYSLSNGRATITGYKGQSTEINIPSIIDNYVVVRIGEYAFENSDMTKLIIPTSIATIGKYAFRNCQQLEEIQFNAKNCTVDDPNNWENHAPDAGPFEKAGFNSPSLTVIFGEEVTTVPSRLFYCDNTADYAHVTSIKISDAVEGIGSSAFRRCYDLSEIIWGKYLTWIGESAFANCISLEEIRIPDGVVTISGYVFQNCKMKKLWIPKSVEKIGRYTFYNCQQLEEIQFNAKSCIVEDPNNWENHAPDAGPFEKAGFTSSSLMVTFGEEVITIPPRLFYCDNTADYAHVTSIKISDGVEGIGYDAFRRCYDLKEIVWGEKLNWIGSGAFADCTSLEEVKIPDEVVTIYGYAFQDCKITKLWIPESVTEIKKYAFQNCQQLEEIQFNAKNCIMETPEPESWSSGKKAGPFEKAGRRASSLTVTFGSNVQKVPDRLFFTDNKSDYAHVTKVEISPSVQTIGDRAFKYCDDLKEITIPRNVTSINQTAFAESGLGKGSVLCERGTTADNTKLYPSGTKIQYVSTTKECSDVEVGTWQYAPIKYVFDKGVMTGKGRDNLGSTIFQPNVNLTRAEFAQILYSMEGKPGIGYTNQFSDVKDGQWYTSAVLWAADKGIVSGYGSGKFGTNDKITREQLAAMLYKYAQYKGYDITASANLSNYGDVNKISSWAGQQIRWAVANGVMSGKGANLDPLGSATRAECAAMVRTFLTKFTE